MALWREPKLYAQPELASRVLSLFGAIAEGWDFW